jgi:hypothetical protein
MPLLRRTNDRHRGVRRLEAAARPAGCDGDEPGDGFMTRHGMVKTSAAGAPPPATYPRAFMVIIAADRVATGSVPGRLNRADAQRSGLSASIAPLLAAIAPSQTSAAD